MITESYVYWILKLDDIRELSFCFGVCCILPMIVFFILFLASTIAKDEFCKDYRHVSRLCGWLCVAATTLALFLHLSYAFLPSTKQMAMIKVIPALANSKELALVSNDAKEIYTLGVTAIKTKLINECNNTRRSK